MYEQAKEQSATTGYDRGAETQPARPALVGSGLDRLDAELDRGAKAVAMLEERIGSVLTAYEDASTEGDLDVVSTGVSLADRIGATCDRAAYVAARIENLHARVEL